MSVLKLDESEDGRVPYFTRLGGTATGGAAFLGLVRMMTSAKTYPDCLALAQKGDATKVNKLVSDIYGQDGCSNLGLAPGTSDFNIENDEMNTGDLCVFWMLTMTLSEHFNLYILLELLEVAHIVNDLT